MKLLLKKSTGLKAKIIENGKFNIRLFKGQLMDPFLKIMPKIGKGLQTAKKVIKENLRILLKLINLLLRNFGMILLKKQSL